MAVEKWFELAAEAAKQSSCLKAQCGAVIVKDGKVIGTGFNSPAAGEPNRCLDNYTIPENNKHDVTCCVHAEIRAIHDALSNYPAELSGSELYFTRIDDNDNIKPSGTPYCTLCSREALDAGISAFALWHKDGIKVYDTEEYNNLSYKFFKEPTLWQSK